MTSHSFCFIYYLFWIMLISEVYVYIYVEKLTQSLWLAATWSDCVVLIYTCLRSRDQFTMNPEYVTRLSLLPSFLFHLSLPFGSPTPNPSIWIFSIYSLWFSLLDFALYSLFIHSIHPISLLVLYFIHTPPRLMFLSVILLSLPFCLISSVFSSFFILMISLHPKPHSP